MQRIRDIALGALSATILLLVLATPAALKPQISATLEVSCLSDGTLASKVVPLPSP